MPLSRDSDGHVSTQPWRWGLPYNWCFCDWCLGHRQLLTVRGGMTWTTRCKIVWQQWGDEALRWDRAESWSRCSRSYQTVLHCCVSGGWGPVWACPPPDAFAAYQRSPTSWCRWDPGLL